MLVSGRIGTSCGFRFASKQTMRTKTIVEENLWILRVSFGYSCDTSNAKNVENTQRSQTGPAVLLSSESEGHVQTHSSTKAECL